jgi:sulfite reductase alpha subunit-like flavoprotein
MGWRLAPPLQTLTKMKPRFYSIASAHEMFPTDVQLTVGVLSVSAPLCMQEGMQRNLDDLVQREQTW